MLEKAEKIGKSDKRRTEAELSLKNPNIFLKLGKEGTILCANRAANAILEYWGVKEGEKVPEGLRHNIKRILAQEEPNNLEIQAGETTYAAVLYPFPEEDYVNLQGFDISLRVLKEEKLRKREKQYLSLSNLGRISVTCKNLQEILEESALLIAKGLGTDFSRILELTPDGTFIMRAGYGWKEEYKDSVIKKEKSQAEYTLVLKRPIIVGDLETETRFECSEFLRRHEIASGVTVLIGDTNNPFGVMEIYSREKREFTEDEIYFLDSAAFLLSEIIERLHAEEKLRAHHQELEKLVEKRTLEYTEANEKLLHEVMERRKIENKLQDNVRFLETLLDSIPSPVFQRDLNETYVNCNESFARQIMGLPKNEVIGGSFREFQKRVPKELAEIYHKHDRNLIEEGGSNYYETKVLCADDVQRDFLFHKATYKDSSGEVAGIVGVMLDITQRKEAEKTFRRGEEKHRIAAEQTGQLVYDYDVESGRIDWAGAISQLTGYSSEEFKQVGLEAWIRNIHEEDQERAWKTHENCMKAGGKYFEEYRFKKKDGSYFHAEDSSIYLLDEKGQTYRAVGVIKDITERKLARETLERNEERYRAVAVQTGQLIYDYDVKNNHSSWAGAIEELTGYNFEEFQGFTPEVWAGHVHPEDREKALKAHENCMGTGEKYVEEYRFRRKDGSYFYVEDSGVYLKDERRDIYRVLGVIKDITERKKATEKVWRSEEKYRIAAEQTGQIVYDYNQETGLMEWAGAVKEITGYSAEEFRQFDTEVWLGRIHPEDRERAMKNIVRLIGNGERFNEEFRFRRKDGNYIHVEDSGVWLKDEKGQLNRALGVIKDITERRLAQEKLEKSEEKYRIAAEQTGQIVYDYDTKTEEVDWAGAIPELTGYSFEEFQKINPEIWLEHIHPDDREEVTEKVRLFFEKGERLREDFRFRRKDGDYIYVEDRGVLLRDEEGSAYRLLGVMKDITKLKMAQENLEKIEERYRIAAEQTGQIVYDYDRLTGKIKWAGAIKELTQYTIEEFRNFNRRAWETHIHTEDRKDTIEKLEEYRERGERFAAEYRFRRKDGSYLYVEDSGIFLKDEQGHSYRDIGVMKDITGIKLASKKLKESEERYRSFMKNFRGVAFQGTLDFIPILVDGSVEEITGYKGEDFVSGKVSWNQIVLPVDREKLVNNNENLKSDPLLLIEHEYRIRHRDGKIKWVREIVQNVSDFTGKNRILQGAVYDITGQKEAEESLKKVEEIRKKEIHHRIKNNLQVISSLLELQAERFAEKEVLEAFRESQNRVATMAIIHEELYRSRNNETLDFSVYLQKLTADLLRSYIVRKDQITMKLDIEETFLGMDTAVPLGIAINELVSNSLKHAFPQGRKGEIKIKLCRAEENGENKSISNSINNIGAKSSVDKSSQYSLVVSDNGLGFPEMLDFRNTGSLGLQLVNILIEQLEGTIELQKGAGTTFKILFKEND